MRLAADQRNRHAIAQPHGRRHVLIAIASKNGRRRCGRLVGCLAAVADARHLQSR